VVNCAGEKDEKHEEQAAGEEYQRYQTKEAISCTVAVRVPKA
jgi:hypothetical protein